MKIDSFLTCISWFVISLLTCISWFVISFLTWLYFLVCYFPLDLYFLIPNYPFFCFTTLEWWDAVLQKQLAWASFVTIINLRVLPANRGDLGFLFHTFSNPSPPPSARSRQPLHPPSPLHPFPVKPKPLHQQALTPLNRWDKSERERERERNDTTVHLSTELILVFFFLVIHELHP